MLEQGLTAPLQDAAELADAVRCCLPNVLPANVIVILEELMGEGTVHVFSQQSCTTCYSSFKMSQGQAHCSTPQAELIFSSALVSQPGGSAKHAHSRAGRGALTFGMQPCV